MQILKLAALRPHLGTAVSKNGGFCCSSLNLEPRKTVTRSLSSKLESLLRIPESHTQYLQDLGEILLNPDRLVNGVLWEVERR